MNLSDLHFIITGGTGTLGSAATQQFLEAGTKISIPCFDEKELDDFSVKNHENIYIETGIDLTDEKATQQFYANALEEYGTLWGSVNIAGGFGMGTIEDTSQAEFMKQINLNLVTCYNSCRAAVQQFKSQGSDGRIVNIAARPAIEPRQGAGMTAYTTAKAGVAAFTQALAEEVVDAGILVNAIAPSIIDTPQNRENMSDANFAKWPKPEQLARQIAYLVSPENQVTRGGIVPVYGQS